MYELKIYKGNEPVTTIQLKPNTNYTIGRSLNNDIVILDRWVSKIHFRLFWWQPRLTFFMLDGSISRPSTNGVKVNDVLVKSAYLKNQDKLTISANVSLIFINKNQVDDDEGTYTQK